ncbi:SusE domain-containing protein [Pedobacter caeni]|uniref:SusE outer membrane protein n=1 Tax=Pedobacter caeni TaxID=288992 RepID=A0A1M5E0K3_9SPHI|nr:SusE domain-containing protein [Pedobacter caeni]SHF72602.1 SusE outer membrane protein [Pedobacter caeni]
MKKILSLVIIAVIAIAGCKQNEFDNTIKGEALGSFILKSPEMNAMLALNSATPDQQVLIEWSAALPGVNTPATYTWIAALKTGSLDAPLLEIPSDNKGLANKLSITEKALDEALKAKGIAEGIKTELIWTVLAKNGSVSLRATETFNLSITRFGDGTSKFALYAPASTFDVVSIEPVSSAELLKFKWQKSFPTKAGSNVTYKVKFIKNSGDFNTPLMEFIAANNGADSTFSITYKDLDLAMKTAGLTDQFRLDSLKWNVEASSGAFKKFADYSNDLVIKRGTKPTMYLIGSATPADWINEANNALIPEMTAVGDGKWTITLSLKKGGFKFIPKKGSWDPSYGGSPGGSDLGGDDINIPEAGTYTVTLDELNKKYTVVKN